VQEDEPAPSSYPFKTWFDSGDPRSEFVGLTREAAEARATREELSLRILELPLVGHVGWRADRRSNRVNLLVSDGRVIRAAIF
jgi:hypothetical protein